MRAWVDDICRWIEVSVTQRDACLRLLAELVRGMSAEELGAAYAGILGCVSAWNCEDSAELALMIEALMRLADAATERGHRGLKRPDAAALRGIPRPDAELSALLDRVQTADPGNFYVAIDKRGRVVELSEAIDRTHNPHGVYVGNAADILRYLEAVKAAGP